MGYLQVRVDDDIKEQASKIYESIGLDLSTAVRMFLISTIAEGGIPIDLKSEIIRQRGLKAIAEMQEISRKNGNCNMTLDEINEEIRLARLERAKSTKRSDNKELLDEIYKEISVERLETKKK